MTFRCFWVDKAPPSDPHGPAHQQITDRPLSDLPQPEGPAIRIAVEYSALNYKDAMAAKGNPGIVRRFPHIPGIDAVGTVVESDVAEFTPGQSVLVTGYNLGVGHFGAWAEQIVVPAEWVLHLPPGLSSREAIILGTAGFTAAQCVDALQRHDITPESGKIVVTGASGGVASLAIKILAQLGYHVVAVTRKMEQRQRLLDWKATEVVSPDELLDTSERAMLSGRFAGAVDTVGGAMLESVLKQIAYRGCVTACGVAGGSHLNTTVYPFLLRGVTLAGIDSAMCPAEPRQQIWQKLAGPWKPHDLSEQTNELTLDQVPDAVDRMLAGQHVGRSIIRIGH